MLRAVLPDAVQEEVGFIASHEQRSAVGRERQDPGHLGPVQDCDGAPDALRVPQGHTIGLDGRDRRAVGGEREAQDRVVTEPPGPGRRRIAQHPVDRQPGQGDGPQHEQTDPLAVPKGDVRAPAPGSRRAPVSGLGNRLAIPRLVSHGSSPRPEGVRIGGCIVVARLVWPGAVTWRGRSMSLQPVATDGRTPGAAASTVGLTTSDRLRPRSVVFDLDLFLQGRAPARPSSRPRPSSPDPGRRWPATLCLGQRCREGPGQRARRAWLAPRVSPGGPRVRPSTPPPTSLPRNAGPDPGKHADPDPSAGGRRPAVRLWIVMRGKVNGSRHRRVSRDPCRHRGATRPPSAGPGGSSTALTYLIALPGRTEHEQPENAVLPTRRVAAPEVRGYNRQDGVRVLRSNHVAVCWPP